MPSAKLDVRTHTRRFGSIQERRGNNILSAGIGNQGILNEGSHNVGIANFGGAPGVPFSGNTGAANIGNFDEGLLVIGNGSKGAVVIGNGRTGFIRVGPLGF